MKRFATLAAVVTMMGAASLARADGLPQEEIVCEGKQVGDACEGGTCQDARCTRADYANWNRDASAGPPSVEYACVECVPGPGPTDAGSTTARDAGTKAGSDAGSKPQAAESDSGGDSSSSCALVLGRATKGFGPWLLALGFGLLVGRRRPRA